MNRLSTRRDMGYAAVRRACALGPVIRRVAVAGLVVVFASALVTTTFPISNAEASVASTQHLHPNLGINGVNYLCGPTTGYSCTPGYTGTNASGWAAQDYGCPKFASGCPGTPHNCTLYAAFRLMGHGVTLNWYDNADSWAIGAAAHGTQVNQNPAVGSIAQWNLGIGHVAYVESVSSSGIVVTMDDFYTSKPYKVGYTAEVSIKSNSPAWPDNFIHFADQNSGNDTAPKTPTAQQSTSGQMVTWSTLPSLPKGIVLGSLACTSNFCMAAGSPGPSNEVFALDGTSWKQLDGFPRGVGRIKTLACSSATFCLVVSYKQHAAGTNANGNPLARLANYAVRWSGGRWLKPQLLFAYTAMVDWISVQSASCVSTTFCMVSPTPYGSMEWNGKQWLREQGTTSGADGVGYMSCATASFCVAGFDVFVNTWNGKSWKLPLSATYPPPSATTLPGPRGQNSGLACPTSRFCVEVNSTGTAAIWNGQSWSTASVSNKDQNLLSTPSLSTVSCASTTFCVTAGGYGTSYYWNGMDWNLLPVLSSANVISCGLGSDCAIGVGRDLLRYQSVTAKYPVRFFNARDKWLSGVFQDAAAQGLYWHRAATDLRATLSKDGAASSTFTTAINELVNMTSIPETGVSSTQAAEFASDVAGLDRFFDTPNLYKSLF